MSENAGKLGALYYSTATLRDTTISFDTNLDRITDSKARIISSGFENGDKIIVSGASQSGNNAMWSVNAIDTSFLGVGGNLTTESAGAKVTIKTAPDDAQLIGFLNWSFDQKVDVEDITDFDDTAGGVNLEKKYLALINDWTASAEAHWQTTAQILDFLGLQKWVRFFVNWVAIPSVPTPSLYYEGMCDVTGISSNEPVGSVVKSSITFQGDGTLTLVTRTTAWDT